MTGIVEGETYGAATTGSQTEVGESDNTYELTFAGEGNDYTAKASNYVLAENGETLGKLVVTEYATEIVVTTTGGTFTYDGKAHGATVKVSDLPKGYTLEKAESSATATDATVDGPVAATADTLVIKNAQGEDVTSKLNIKKVDGQIVVNPAVITVHAESELIYNGSDQKLDITAEGAKGVVSDETLTLHGATIAGKNVGVYTDVADYAWSVAKADGSNSTGNYTIDVTGKLTIVKAGLDQFQGTVELDNWVYGDQAKAEQPSVTPEGSDYAAPTYQYKVKGADDSTYTDQKPTQAG